MALRSVNMKEYIQIRSQRDKRSQRRLTQVDANGSERSKRDREMEERLNQTGHCSAAREDAAAYDRLCLAKMTRGQRSGTGILSL